MPIDGHRTRREVCLCVVRVQHVLHVERESERARASPSQGCRLWRGAASAALFFVGLSTTTYLTQYTAPLLGKTVRQILQP